MGKIRIYAQKEQQRKYFTVVEWAMLAKKDGSHDGWVRISENAPIQNPMVNSQAKSKVPFIPPEIAGCIPCGKK